MTRHPPPSRRRGLVTAAVVAVALGAGALILLLRPPATPQTQETQQTQQTPPAPLRSKLPPDGGLAPSSINMDTPLGATDIKVDIAQLVAEYLADEQAAEERYAGKTVEVRGVMLGIDREDPEIVAVVVGKQVGGRESPVVCQGRAAFEPAAAALVEGQSVTVRGKFAGRVTMKVVLLNCDIVK